MGNILSSIEKAGRILGLYSSVRPVLRVAEASKALAINPSTVSRLLSTMARVGLVVRDESGFGYRPGPIVLSLAPLAAGRTGIRSCALPWMRELNAATSETVGLHVRVGGYRVCIEQLPSPRELRSVVEVGAQLPLHAGSTGKVLLAYMAADALEAFLQKGLDRLTEDTIIEPQALRVEMERIRAVGYAISCGERAVNVSSISAPVRDASGAVVAALSCSGPLSRWTRSAMEAWVPRIVLAAQEISRGLGYRGSLRTRVDQDAVIESGTVRSGT